MSAGHTHGGGATARAATRHRGRLTAALVLLVTFTVVEAVAAFATHSLALLSDAGHMLTDVVGLAMALAAIHLADRVGRGAATGPAWRGPAGGRRPGDGRRSGGRGRPADVVDGLPPDGPSDRRPGAVDGGFGREAPDRTTAESVERPPVQASGGRGEPSVAGPGEDQRTFGLYRLEILAALANAVLLTAVGVYVVIEAVRRLADPAEVRSGPMLVVAVLGLAANLVAFALLRTGSRESLNVEGAYLEVVADTLGSLGVIVAAVVLQLTGWEWVDPVVGVAVGLFILPRAWRLGGQAVRILVQAAPPGTDLEAMRRELATIAGVVDVHDLHVWTLTSDMDVASAHLMVRAGTDGHSVLDQARVVLRDGYAIDHATLQVEPDDHRGCDQVTW